MDEQFLHYIWKYQKLDSTHPKLTEGQQLKVFYQGNHNHDSGPDFEEARIKIDNIEWAGQIEIHINSSDWIHHNHQHDPAYETVILHVVWNHDKEIYIQGEALPVLELKHQVNLLLIEKYQNHLKSTAEILCESQIVHLSPLIIRGMLDRVLIERLSEKSEQILSILGNSANDWEQITFRTIASNFGFSTNKESFTRLAELLPYKKLKKALQSIKSSEALIFGQSGFLVDSDNAYQVELKTEFDFLSSKYQLDAPLSKAHWKYGKLRPANFPTVRLAQLSALLHHQPQLFNFLVKTDSISELKKKLLVKVGEYWQHHYDFGKQRNAPSLTMGKTSFENILINSVAPILAAYSKYSGSQMFMDRAIEILESIAAENNRITKKWDVLGINAKSAFDSQALIQLYKNYCLKRRCLHCNFGVAILNK